MIDLVQQHKSLVGAGRPIVDGSRGTSMLATRTGFRFMVRPATPADEVALAEFFTHVTPEQLRFRFLSAIRQVNHDQLAAMTAVDHYRTESFLALNDDGLVIATGLIASDAFLECAEVAISIRADHYHRGISWTLLEHIARYAEARGIKVIESIEARDSYATVKLQQEMGFTARAIDGEPTLVRVERRLSPVEPRIAVPA